MLRSDHGEVVKGCVRSSSSSPQDPHTLWRDGELGSIKESRDTSNATTPSAHNKLVFTLLEDGGRSRAEYGINSHGA